MLAFQPLPEATIANLINALLQVKLLPHRLPLDLHPKEVHITLFPEGYYSPLS